MLTVLDLNLRGDLDADGLPDAVMHMVYWTGGSGVFNHLAAVIDDQGQPRHVATVELGDRVRLKGAALEEGRIAAKLVVHGDEDPACCPTVPVTRVYRLVQGRLVEVAPDGEAR
jgi:hypothetical protein